MPEANQGDRAVLEHFLDSMWMERGLSWNTPQAYGNDLRGLSEWLAKRRQGLLTASRFDILEYLSFAQSWRRSESHSDAAWP